MAINPVGTWADPRHDLVTGTTYKINLDNSIAVGKRIADFFAPHAKAAPDMNVVFDPGYVFNDQVLTEVAEQTISAGSAPAANPRIDRYVIDRLTGVITRVAGTEAGSPVAPAIPEEKDPCARVLMVVSMTEVTNQDITDERLGGGSGGGAVVKLKSGTNQTVSGTSAETTITALTTPIAAGALGTNNWQDFFVDISDLDIPDGGEFINIRCKFDGTTFAHVILTPVDACAGVSNQAGMLWIRLRNDGATNSQRGQIITFVGAALISSGASVGTSAVDTTVNKNFTLTVQSSSTSGVITISGQQGIKYS